MNIYHNFTNLKNEKYSLFEFAEFEYELGKILNDGDNSSEVAMAICYFRASERKYLKLKNIEKAAEVNLNLGHAYYTMLDSNYKRNYMHHSIRHFKKAKDLYEKLKNQGKIKECLHCLFHCRKALIEDGELKKI